MEITINIDDFCLVICEWGEGWGWEWEDYKAGLSDYLCDACHRLLAHHIVRAREQQLELELAAWHLTMAATSPDLAASSSALAASPVVCVPTLDRASHPPLLASTPDCCEIEKIDLSCSLEELTVCCQSPADLSPEPASPFCDPAVLSPELSSPSCDLVACPTPKRRLEDILTKCIEVLPASHSICLGDYSLILLTAMEHFPYFFPYSIRKLRCIFQN